MGLIFDAALSAATWFMAWRMSARTCASASTARESAARLLCANSMDSCSSPMRLTCGMSATLCSMSKGIARSMNARLCGSGVELMAFTTVSVLITVPRAPVTLTIRLEWRISSTSESSDSSVNEVVRSVPSCCASSSACSIRRRARSAVRLMTVSDETPERTNVATASPDMAPAPTTSARAPLISPKCSRAAKRAVSRSELETVSSAVSVWARLPISNARLTARSKSPVKVPAVRASLSAVRTWPRICASPIAIESRPAVSSNRCSYASVS